MVLTILNQTSSILSYVNNTVSVPANGSTSISTGVIPYLALDPSFKSDVTLQNVLLSDGVNTYSKDAAFDYVSVWLNTGPPQNSNDAISFTLAGYGYTISNDLSLPNTNEIPLLYFLNPNTSTVNARLMYSYGAIDSTQGVLTTRVYVNPTVSANGVAVTPQNAFISSNSLPASSMNIYGGPTVSSNGTKKITLVNSALSSPPFQHFNQTAILGPGNSLLITGQASNLGLLAALTGHFYLHWVEI